MHAAGRREGRPATAADFVAAVPAGTDPVAVSSGVAVSCYAATPIANAIPVPATVATGDTTGGPTTASSTAAATSAAAATLRQCGPYRQRDSCEGDHEHSEHLHVACLP